MANGMIFTLKLNQLFFKNLFQVYSLVYVSEYSSIRVKNSEILTKIDPKKNKPKLDSPFLKLYKNTNGAVLLTI